MLLLWWWCGFSGAASHEEGGGGECRPLRECEPILDMVRTYNAVTKKVIKRKLRTQLRSLMCSRGLTSSGKLTVMVRCPSYDTGIPPESSALFLGDPMAYGGATKVLNIFNDPKNDPKNCRGAIVVGKDAEMLTTHCR